MGVTVSLSMSTPTTGNPLKSSSVAGPGAGSGPCAERTMPRPNGIREKVKDSMPKFVNADRCCHDVDDGIGGADFMEMDTVDGDAVNLGFGLRQARENLDTRCL